MYFSLTGVLHPQSCRRMIRINELFNIRRSLRVKSQEDLKFDPRFLLETSVKKLGLGGCAVYSQFKSVEMEQLFE